MYHFMMLDASIYIPRVQEALAEDVGSGDITSKLLLPESKQASFAIVAREPIILCGAEIAAYSFRAVSQDTQIKVLYKDGARVCAGEVLMHVSGQARALLTAERTALNFLQHLSGIATWTHRFVEAVAGTSAKILDTRKTTPCLRALEKYAVACGGGTNHRMRLDDGILIKDNHLAAGLTIAEAVQKAKSAQLPLPIIVECDTLDQVKEAVTAGATRVLLDNMSVKEVQEAAAICRSQVETEASGGLNLANVRHYAKTGVNYLSIGALTHSAPNVDIGLDAL